MTKQEFSIRLLYFFMPYPLSKKLPALFHRLFRGPSAEFPNQWAQSAFDVISSILADMVAAAESLLASIEGIIPTEQLSSLSADLRAAIEAAQQSLSLLSDIVSDLSSYTQDQIISAFSDVSSSIDGISNISDSISGIIPSPPVVAPPVYTPPVPPIYIGPPVPGPSGPSWGGNIFRGLKAVWFNDDFLILDPAVWTDSSDGTGVCSIVDQKLKMLSAAPGDYAYLATANDNTIPETFRLAFWLKIDSGTGKMTFEVSTGVHILSFIFQAPDTLRFRRKQPAGYIDIDVGNYMGANFYWRFSYDGTLCTIKRGSTEIAADLTIHETPTNKGRRVLITEDILTVHLSKYWIVYPV